MRKYLTGLSIYFLTLIIGYYFYIKKFSYNSTIGVEIIFIIIPIGLFISILLEFTARFKKIESSIIGKFLASVLFSSPLLISGQNITFVIWTLSNLMFLMSRTKVKNQITQYILWIITVIGIVFTIH